MKIKFVVPSYNTEKWCHLTVNSIKAQSFKDWECVIIDDMSTDNTYKKLRKICKKDDRIHLIKNTEKKYALGNIVAGIEFLSPSDEDIVFELDGDDWFSQKDSLQKVYAAHNSGAWMTYGSYIEYPNGVKGKFAKQLSIDIIKNVSYRSSPWCTSQLRTFRYGLWKRIEDKDLRDINGNYYRMAWDLAFMFPMLEMTAERSRYISDIIYVYNLETPINDHKIDNRLQMKLEMEIREKQKYERIEKL